MIRIILSGANGNMGHVITSSVAEDSNLSIVAGIDVNTSSTNGYHVFSSAKECAVQADVIIDFSHPAVLDALLEMAIDRNLPVVIATTGLSDSQIKKIHEASKKIPVFFSANMSLGVNLMSELAKIAVRVLGTSFDIEIIEKHHNQKIDAPSGTALALAEAISQELENPPQYVYDRHSQRKKRQKNEIGIHSIRGGTIVGAHDILFSGRDELISITHTATSKEIFATGAISAAVYLSGKAPGLYSMSDLIEAK